MGHEDLNEHWVGAGHLKIGDKIKQADGTTGVVANVISLQQTREMFNLTVSEAHTYYMGQGGWLVHNASCPSAAGQLPPLAGKPYQVLLKQLDSAGFRRTNTAPNGNRTWAHPDGLKVLVHPYGNQANAQWLQGTTLTTTDIIPPDNL